MNLAANQSFTAEAPNGSHSKIFTSSQPFSSDQEQVFFDARNFLMCNTTFFAIWRATFF
jgi:hypothetical protein